MYVPVVEDLVENAIGQPSDRLIESHNDHLKPLIAANNPREQKTWVRIPPGNKGLKENIAMLLNICN
jgi:hypothetical protein